MTKLDDGEVRHMYENALQSRADKYFALIWYILLFRIVLLAVLCALNVC